MSSEESRLRDSNSGPRLYESAAPPPGGSQSVGFATPDDAGRTSLRTSPAEGPSDLARVVDAWPTLPDPIRRAVLALVGTAAPAAPTAGRDLDDALPPGYERAARGKGGAPWA